MPTRKTPAMNLPVPVELVARRILFIRGLRVMLDSDLAELYQVPTSRLNEAVKRNSSRFPADFMFQLTAEELENWRSQIAMSNPKSKMGLRRAPYAFTELGVAMLSTVLNSKRAVQMNIFIMRAFVKLREVLAANKMLAQKVEQLTATQKEHATLFEMVIADIQKLEQKFTREIRLMQAPRRPKQRIGSHLPKGK
jgi:hypothetical protein